MSVARGEFIDSLAGIDEALALESLTQGAMATKTRPGINILRRGILVAGLIAIESFVRNRTIEALQSLERWPRSYEDLPEKLRLAARLNALSHLQNFAKMLKRQGDDFELELEKEIAKIASGHGSVQQFTRFVAGDFTGNLSDTSLKELLSSLQVDDCWNTFRIFAGDAGMGVPSVQEVLKNLVRRRHRSAHSAAYTPTATEIAGLRRDLICIAMCYDVSVSSSMEQALLSPEKWANGELKWRTSVNLYIAEPHVQGFRLTKFGRTKALHIVCDISTARQRIPRPNPGQIAVLVEHDASGRPHRWDIL